MSLRDQTEHVLRSWNAYEINRDAPPVVDFDCQPPQEDVTPASDRVAVAVELDELKHQATAAGDELLAQRLDAHRAYFGALLGERPPIREYIQETQGCPAHGWTDDYITDSGDRVRADLAALGIPWDQHAAKALDQAEGPIAVDDAADAIRAAAVELEPAVRSLTGSSAPYNLHIENVDVDAYWGYWLDGKGQDVRLRINLRHAQFTKVKARQFALHEVLGHGLQCASFSHTAATRDVPWVRVTSVHAQQQTLLEGLATALPLFVTPEDQQLVTRVHLAHYSHLVQAELHLAINEGVPARECVERCRQRIPFWTDDQIGDTLTDRSVDPLLRSYLWSYPAGTDWFVHLAGADPETRAAVFRSAYESPLSPQELSQLWPAGPQIGGNDKP